ncbi:GD13119 [Drosophila simulans]|uniref:GD13119 n=1 Tax=Drosophila simulans TaxID=7240 RepID=B4QJS6_DROSI|nr:GD13119 [Drosophila simulans]
MATGHWTEHGEARWQAGGEKEVRQDTKDNAMAMHIMAGLSQVDNSTTATLIRNIEGQRGRDREPGQGKLIISRRSPPSFSSLLNSSKDARGRQQQEQREQKQKQQLEQPFEFPIGGGTSMRHGDAIRWTLAYPSRHPG